MTLNRAPSCHGHGSSEAGPCSSGAAQRQDHQRPSATVIQALSDVLSEAEKRFFAQHGGSGSLALC